MGELLPIVSDINNDKSYGIIQKSRYGYNMQCFTLSNNLAIKIPINVEGIHLKIYGTRNTSFFSHIKLLPTVDGYNRVLGEALPSLMSVYKDETYYYVRAAKGIQANVDISSSTTQIFSTETISDVSGLVKLNPVN